jgi:hypothetical protein
VAHGEFLVLDLVMEGKQSTARPASHHSEKVVQELVDGFRARYGRGGRDDIVQRLLGVTLRRCHAWHGGRHGVAVLEAWRPRPLLLLARNRRHGLPARETRMVQAASQSRKMVGEGGERRWWRLENGEE